MIDIKFLSSLEKVFINSDEQSDNYCHGSMLKAEKFSFQVALRLKKEAENKFEVNIQIVSQINKYIKIKEVKSVPVSLPAYPDRYDENYLSREAGLFPDLLTDGCNSSLMPGQWKTFWIMIDSSAEIEAGDYDINIQIIEKKLGRIGDGIYKLDVIDAVLPKQCLIHTEWLHCDCIAQYHQVEVFSEPFWELTEKYIRMASDYGVNMILTPIFTPPLDTKVNGERLTVQLVDVYLTDGTFSFNFDKLKRWVIMCERNNIEYFEFSHLFTQWGAGYAPKIVVDREGELIKYFGWHTASDTQEYQNFLRVFLKEIKVFIGQMGMKNRCYFHVSDEPSLSDIEQYEKAYLILRESLEDEFIIDALSDYEFYKQGIVQKPIPASNFLEEFIENKVQNLWTYYCCSQNTEVSNRFMAMPSARNRIFGIQLYKYDMEGFLHWGFNFYNSQHSIEEIDPYLVTDAKQAFPSGDAFLVYPTENGVTESIRLVVFHEALQDLRALRLLETLTSRNYVLNLIKTSWENEITFKKYPLDAEYILNFRAKINELIKTFHHTKMCKLSFEQCLILTVPN